MELEAVKLTKVTDSHNPTFKSEAVERIIGRAAELSKHEPTSTTSTDWHKRDHHLSRQWLAFVGPLERLSHGAVEVLDKLQNPGFEISVSLKARTAQQLAHQDTEPNLNLIEPRAMLWSEMNHQLM